MKFRPKFEWEDKVLLESIRTAKLREILSEERKEGGVQSP